MRAHIHRLFLLTALIVATACAGTRTIGRERNAERISRSEILSGTYSTAYEVVQALHPNWLRAHNGDSPNLVSQIVVYYDGTKYGGINALNGIRAATIGTIEHVDGPAATIRWGSGHSEGVLNVMSLTH